MNRPDLEPGFWINAEEANNRPALSKAIQYPLNDPHWQSRVLNAYFMKAKNDKN